MQGISLCARCGLERSTGGTNGISRRTALLGILSSGFLAKMLLGAVALAAVGGGVAVSGPPRVADAPSGATATTPSFLQTEANLVNPGIIASSVAPETLDDLVEQANSYARALRSWGDCVSSAARDYQGGAFDPHAACGETPSSSDYGLDSPQLLKVEKESTVQADQAIAKATEKAVDKAAATIDKATEKTATTVEKAVDKAISTIDKATEKVADKATETVEEATDAAADAATDKADKTIDKATDKADKTIDKATDKADKTIDKATDKADKNDD
jgi:vacuolar-type H+-ATPase subunit H